MRQKSTPARGKVEAKPVAMKALQRAAQNALNLGKRTGTPVYVLEKGKIIDLT
jgi:hypothetical protein